MQRPGHPPARGLYDGRNEHDACGVGMIVDLKGRKDHQLVRDTLQILANLDHRGACGCEANTGDGAGILIQVPDAFLRRVAKAEAMIELPPAGQYGVGLVFLPRDEKEAVECRKTVERIAADDGLKVLGWRKVPTRNEGLGDSAKEVEPRMEHLFVAGQKPFADEDAFERRLFLVRKCAEHAVRGSDLPQKGWFYVCSLSCRTLVYKGMLTSPQLAEYFPDLDAKDLASALALTHSRFSTNTFPSWDLAHPFRYLAHNGEINTLRGNINWMKARESLFECTHFTKDEMARLLPVILDGGSDSAMLDNALEMLVVGGRSLAHAVMMLIPEAWSKHEAMDPARKAFYEFHACLMEPWDGPASVAFTDGKVAGAVLDRNGLRPSRYYVTHDDRIVMASEVGVLDIAPENVKLKGRLQPGRMFLVDLKQGRIVADEEIKKELAAAQPYAKWLDKNLVELEDLPAAAEPTAPDDDTLRRRLHAFGYTAEDVKILIQPMALNGEEALGSMGNDAALAVLSERPQLLYNYFKQLFAQVTNPPLDAIREELVTDIQTWMGPEGNLLAPAPKSCRKIKLPSPVLDNAGLAKLKKVKIDGLRPSTLPILFEVPARTADANAAQAAAGRNLEAAMLQLFERAEQAVGKGAGFLILSDRGADERYAPIPALLAVSGLHHHLVRRGLRTRVGLVLESGEPREVHHFACLLGYGADAVNPYLAFEAIGERLRSGALPQDLELEAAVYRYIKAANKGVVKVMSKMGISTIQSYRGAQIFEAVGLNTEVVDRYFTKTASRVEGVGVGQIAAEQVARHRRAWPERTAPSATLDPGGQYQWRRGGENHLFNPATVHKLQHAVRTGSYKLFKEYTRAIDDQARNLCTLRGLFALTANRPPVPIEEVEPAASIVKRFATGAMSYGSISKEAHENLAIAMNRLGGMSNTGEGGEDEDRFTPDANGDNRCSAIKQVASGRFGVTSRYLVSARELQIKMAQGAKPGEGGQLPAHKVYPWIAKTRHATPYVGLISPPPHHDIYSIEDLAQLIFDLKNANPRARVSVKLVAEVGVGTVAAGVCKAHADMVLISGHDGGTGASPLTSIKHAGVPWELGLAETHQVLVTNGLRDRIAVQCDGQLKTGRDVVIAALLGAEEFGFATTALVASGCIMMRVCHLDTCPVGVATQNPELRKKFSGKPEDVVNFMLFIAEEVREHLAALGFRSLQEAVGQVECVKTQEAIAHWKARGLDFTKILAKPEPWRSGTAPYKVSAQDHGIDAVLDQELLKACAPALERGEKVRLERAIRNTDRTTGTILGSEITRRHPEGLKDGTVRIAFTGSAGQSFGAFLPKGVALSLEGDSNDFLGKGLCGGRLSVFPPKGSSFAAEESVIVGNVVGYGATSGSIFIRGIAGERFCVRNSGANAVVEGVGDHGCEYMTGGRVVVLGKTGRNFAAGMSGGIAYVLDEHGRFARHCNTEMVDLEPVQDAEEAAALRKLVEQHHKETGSLVAKRALEHWDAALRSFVKVMPRDYKRALEQLKTEQPQPQEAVAD
ncbi:MAG: glutamate synthase large subunit [Planctomycetes bacterium]|nr:glutamate synthase large subunit [Planctomycetota bacterium]